MKMLEHLKALFSLVVQGCLRKQRLPINNDTLWNFCSDKRILRPMHVDADHQSQYAATCQWSTVENISRRFVADLLRFKNTGNCSTKDFQQGSPE